MQQKFKFDKETLKKIGLSALLLVAGAGATALQDLIPTIDFGQWTPVIFALNTWLINTIREFIKGKDIQDYS